MRNKSTILFVVNPNAGRKNGALTQAQLNSVFPPEQFEIIIKCTEAERHASELTRQYRDKVNAIVAVGGDGTINEIGSELVNSEVALGILPAGSGNGLARSLNIPLKWSGALKVIKRNATRKIDSIVLNDTYFFNMAGVGFDAFVARMFSKVKSRGLQGYVFLVLKHFFTYKGKRFEIDVNGDLYKERAFLVSFANSSQYGNNAHIAPGAKLDDGLFELCVVKDFPRWRTPGLAFKLFRRQINSSSYYESRSVDAITLKGKGEIWAHLDGEPRIFNDEIKMSIMPGALKVIV